MNRQMRQRGSAMLVAVIVTIMVVGLGAAFLVETVFRGKRQNTILRSDEALAICDTALEVTRLAIKEWRNNDPLCPAPGPALPPQQYAWNLAFQYCITNDLGSATWKTPAVPPGTQCLSDPDAIKANYMALVKQFGASLGAPSYAGFFNLSPTGPVRGESVLPISPGIPLYQQQWLLSQLFCRWRLYGGGAYWVQMKNNDESTNTPPGHGDGIDDDQDGDPWNNEVGDAGKPVPFGTPVGTSDPLIDGDRQAILVITACLPDGTVRQIEALVQFPQRKYTPAAALLDAGTIKMSGSFDILGSKGVVQANEDLIGSGGGTAHIEQSANASGSAAGFTMLNQPKNGINSGVTPASLPDIKTIDQSFLSGSNMAGWYDYVVRFDAAGNAFSNSFPGDNTFTKPVGTAADFGFANKSGAWGLGGNVTPPAAIYYFDGNVAMSGQGNAQPYYMSIVASGSVKLTGNVNFSAMATTSSGTWGPQSSVLTTTNALGQKVPVSTSNTLVVAGQDVELGGTAGNNLSNPQYAGAILAVEQVFIHGNFSMNGAVIGLNVTDTPGSLVTTSSQVAPDATVVGNPTIQYNGFGTFLPMAAAKVTVINVRRTN